MNYSGKFEQRSRVLASAQRKGNHDIPSVFFLRISGMAGPFDRLSRGTYTSDGPPSDAGGWKLACLRGATPRSWNSTNWLGGITLTNRQTRFHNASPTASFSATPVTSLNSVSKSASPIFIRRSSANIRQEVQKFLKSNFWNLKINFSDKTRYKLILKIYS